MFDRFIFVNYHAWNFAGCDFLWAGIVKALVKEIEKEFGASLTRWFRSISLKPIPEYESQRAYGNQCDLLLEFNDEHRDRKILKEKMKKLGGPSVAKCQTLINWEKDNRKETRIEKKDKFWVVQFKEASEAYEAYKNLKAFDGVKASFMLQAKTKAFYSDKKWSNASKNVKFINTLRFENILKSVGFFVFVTVSAVLISLAIKDHYSKVIFVLSFLVG